MGCGSRSLLSLGTIVELRHARSVSFLVSCCTEGGLADKLDGSLPIEPGGTHRWLIQIPPEATQGDEGPKLWIYLRAKSGEPELTLHTGTLQMSGSDATRLVDYETNLSFVADYPYAALPITYEWSADDGPLPRYAIAVLHNPNDTPLRYELTLNQPSRCMEECKVKVGAALNANGCPEAWCDGSENFQECVQYYRSEIGEIIDGNWTTGVGYCDFVCRNTFDALDVPYPSAASGWPQDVCGVSGMSDEACLALPAGMVPMSRWPIPECGDIIE